MRERAADRRLMRYLHGELPAEQVRALRAELARDPALQARLAELHRLWQGLQPSAPTPAPFGYVPKLQRLAEQRRATSATSVVGWGAAPPWARALAAAALVAGVALGVGLGRMPQAPAAATVAAVPTVAPTTSGAPTNAAATIGTAAAPSARPTARPGAVASPTLVAGATPSAPEATPGARGTAEPGASVAAEPAEAILSEESAVLAGSSTMAEEYWQALEGIGDGGGEGDAGW